MTETSHAGAMSTMDGRDEERSGPTAWVGWIFFAANILILAGFVHLTMGFVALFNDGYFSVTRHGLLVSTEYTTWGVIHMVLGAGAAVTGFVLMLGRMWARVLGVGVAVVSVFTNVAFLAANPIWSMCVIAFDVIVIYALIVHGGEVEDAVA
jgi:hypothetical protein